MHKVGLFCGVVHAQLVSSSSNGPHIRLTLLARQQPQQLQSAATQLPPAFLEKMKQHVKVAAFIFYNWSFAIKLFLPVLLPLPAETDFPPRSPHESPSSLPHQTLARPSPAPQPEPDSPAGRAVPPQLTPEFSFRCACGVSSYFNICLAKIKGQV